MGVTEKLVAKRFAHTSLYDCEHLLAELVRGERGGLDPAFLHGLRLEIAAREQAAAKP